MTFQSGTLTSIPNLDVNLDHVSLHVNFGQNFTETPVVVVSTNSGSAGDWFMISTHGIDTHGFNVVISRGGRKNNYGTPPTINWIACAPTP